MSKKLKLLKFEQNKGFPHFFEPNQLYMPDQDFQFKSCWNKEFFKNPNPIVVEFGCGKGEYAVELAKMYPDKNFVGIDIKGARMWKGAKDSLELNMKNIAFVRTRADFAQKCFDKNEVSEIWITFPDPQLGPKKRIRKRLTSTVFLRYYQNILIDNGIINLKTDDDTLYEYTKSILTRNQLEILIDTADLYASEYYNNILAIKTHYEKIWNKENKTIKYLRFRLPNNLVLNEVPVDEDE
jgi:tRNA (guanine-N7-)-methyltransferase